MVTPLDRKRSQCTNCGEIGHHYRGCVAPISSYGMIAFRVNPSIEWNQAKSLTIADTDLTGIPSSAIQVLLIQRKNSIGYVELLRCKYKLTDLHYIREQIAGTTEKERQQLLAHPFTKLWQDLWGIPTDGRQYRQEYEQAKVKFEHLVEGIQIEGEHYTLASLIASIPLRWETPEWGFPKGRRNLGESDLACASREFGEETGLYAHQYRIFENLEPIREVFFGNNNIHYAHIYYIAWVPSCVDVSFNAANPHMQQEVGDLGWFHLDDALQKIRATNIEKREILLRASSILRNLCPLLVGPVATLAEQWSKIEAGTSNRSRTDNEYGGGSNGFSSSDPNSRYQFVDE